MESYSFLICKMEILIVSVLGFSDGEQRCMGIILHGA